MAAGSDAAGVGEEADEEESGEEASDVGPEGDSARRVGEGGKAGEHLEDEPVADEEPSGEDDGPQPSEEDEGVDGCGGEEVEVGAEDAGDGS